MDLFGEQLLPLPRERVFDALLDPVALKASIPGCESITPAGEGAYSVAVVAAIGPVKARFKGLIRQQNVQRPHGYLLAFEGDGGVAGFAKGSAEVELTDEGNGHTRLKYVAKAQIGGRLAAIGSRLIDAAAAKMSAQFFAQFTDYLTGAQAQPAAPQGAAAPAGAGHPVTPAPMTVVPVAVAPAAAQNPSLVTFQMPAWTWAFTIVVLALLTGWLAKG
jgi:carbon monoxide dehydrogenase subunit G